MCVLHSLGIASDTYGLLFLVPDWPTCDIPRRLGDNNTIELKKKSILPKQMQIGCQWQKRAHSRNSLCSFSIKKKFYPKKQNDNTNDKFSGNERATGTRIISFFFFCRIEVGLKTLISHRTLMPIQQSAREFICNSKSIWIQWNQ